jgi:hypothetical protein
MLLNEASRKLLARTKRAETVVSHDWWAYILISALDGAVRYTDAPLVNYRQHGNNLVGSNSSFYDRLTRIRKIFLGTFRDWNERNLRELGTFHHLLPIQNKRTLELFIQSRQASPIKRLKLLWQSGVYRQTRFGAIGLLIAAIFKRM